MVAFICCHVQVFGAQGSLLGSIVVANVYGVLLLCPGVWRPGQPTGVHCLFTEYQCSCVASQVFGAQGSLLGSIMLMCL